MRRSEVIELRWSQIDFDNNIFYIDHTVVVALVDGVKREVASASTKTEGSRRVHELIEPLKIRLLQRKEQIERNRNLYGNSYSTDYLEYVCVDDLGTSVGLSYVTTVYPALLKRVGLRRIRFHDLRHTSASLLLKAGLQLTDVMHWLGHKNYKTTQHYSHLEARSKGDWAQALSARIFDSGK